jgi:hypothetical protein
MSTNLVEVSGSSAITNVEPVPEELTLVASQPEQMQAAQRELGDWFRRKVQLAKADAHDAEENRTIARQNGMKHASFDRVAATAQKRVTFYEKCLAAVDAGYAIVPNFPVDVIAIRVGRERPKYASSTARTQWGLAAHTQECQILPAGEGRYVDPAPFVRDIDITPAGAEQKTLQRTVEGYDEELEFPVEIAKPAVLEATQHALALNLFDEVGVLPGRRRRNRDPIVIGRIYNGANRYRDNPLAFLIAWWIDTRDL